MSMPVAVKSEEVILENAEYNSAEELDEELQLQLEDTGGDTYHIQYQAESQLSHHQRNQNSNVNSSGNSSGKNSNGSGGGAIPNKNVLESEKRMRREIANSNERRRMQSINAGFQNLRSLLPRHEGEKLSKAAILQQTSQYICELEDQKTQLLAQNSQLKRQLGNEMKHEVVSSGGGGIGGGGGGNNAETGTDPVSGVAIKKRKLTDNVINMQTISDSSDEGLGSMSPEPMTLLNANAAANGGQQSKTAAIIAHNVAKELLELKKQLDKERRLRNMLEDELQTIKRQLFSVATAPPQSSSVGGQSSTANYIPRGDVIEHTDNIVREVDLGTVSYVEIDEMTGQQQVVVCSSIEELDNETAADIITEEHIQEEVILSSSSTESEQEINAIAKAYAEGNSTAAAVLQPILQAAIKATPKVEVERINETTIMKVKTEKIEQPSGLTRSRQNLETIVEAIRHLEGDHLFGDVAEQQKQQQHQHQQQLKAQEAPLALTTKQQQLTQRNTLAELRPFLQIKGNKQIAIVGGTSITLTPQQISSSSSNNSSSTHTTAGTTIAGVTSQSQQQQQQQQNKVNSQKDSQVIATPTAILKVQTSNTTSTSGTSAPQVTITATALKQCRPGVIVAKQLS